MGLDQDSGSDKLLNSSKHTLRLSEERSSTLKGEKAKAFAAAEVPAFFWKSENPEVDGIKIVETDISSSDKNEPRVFGDRHPNEEENFKNMDVRMGERLTDDVIDAYCDKLQESVDREIDGMLAMQYILLEPSSIKNLIKGDKNVCQVIYDHCRAHYLVLFRNKLNPKRIIVYDPIVPYDDSVLETVVNFQLNESVREQILTMFGHLYQENEVVEIAVERGLSTQNDCWSCGLRAAAFTTDLLLGIDPANYEYDLEKVGKFIMEIIKMDKPSREIIASAQFGQERKGGKSCLTIVHVTKADNFSIEIGKAFSISNEPSMEVLVKVNGGENEVYALESDEEKLLKSMMENVSKDSNADDDEYFSNHEQEDGILMNVSFNLKNLSSN
uniref:Ubiquitin-like protease family profile domain-containing protein n=1 Tax=Setaria digitata TaxID=48799 RepID=A0A915Q0I1_9BILA